MAAGRQSRVFVTVTAMLTVALLAIAARSASPQSTPIKQRYLSPIEIAISSDGRLLYVVCQDSDEVRIVDTQSGSIAATVSVGHVPRGIAMSPDGRKLYVTNAWSDTVSV